MVKVWIALGLLAASATGGWNARAWYEDSQEKEVIIEKVKNHNEDTISLSIHTKEIADLQKRFEASLRAIPRIVPNNICDIDEHKRVYNEAVRVVNSMPITD